MKFADIPQLTRNGNYSVNISWRYLKEHLGHWNERGELDLDPDFQRAHVWDINKQIKYVEFILRGGTSGRNIYFNHSNWMTTYEGPLVLVDGKQRLNAALKFLDDKIPVFNGNYLTDFSDQLGAMNPNFLFHVNNLPTRAAVLQWYIDLNDGGVAHTQEEINKVYDLLKQEQPTKKD